MRYQYVVCGYFVGPQGDYGERAFWTYEHAQLFAKERAGSNFQIYKEEVEVNYEEQP